MSMNFNPSKPSAGAAPAPAPKKSNNKTIAGIIIMASLVIVATTIGALYLAGEMNNLARQFSPSYLPSASEVTKFCTAVERLKLGTEPTQVMIDSCVQAYEIDKNSPK